MIEKQIMFNIKKSFEINTYFYVVNNFSSA